MKEIYELNFCAKLKTRKKKSKKVCIRSTKSSSTTYMAIVAAVPAGGTVAEAVAKALPTAAAGGAAGPGSPLSPLAGLANHCRRSIGSKHGRIVGRFPSALGRWG